MFDWLKNKMGAPDSEAAAALRMEFEPLEKFDGAPRRLVDRIINFVLTGKDENVIAELARMKGPHGTLVVSLRVNKWRTSSDQKSKGLPALVKQLPEDPELYFRLATVYEALHKQHGVPSHSIVRSVSAFDGPLSWLPPFLVELSDQGRHAVPTFPVSHLLAMIRTSGGDEKMLAKGPFFYENAGQGHPYPSLHPPVAYYHCLSQFPEFVLSSSDVVRPAFHQKEAAVKVALLRSLQTLKISPAPFVEEIAALAVSGPKDIREASVELISQSFPVFKERMRSYAEKGSADERFHAVRVLARAGGAAEHDFLRNRLDKEKSAKVSEAIQKALPDESTEQALPAEEEFKFPEVPEVPVHAPLNKDVLVDLRRAIQEFESVRAEQFANSPEAKRGVTRTPIAADAADQLFEALQTFVKNGINFLQFLRDGRDVQAALLHHFQIPPQFQLIHLVRWCLLLNKEYGWYQPFFQYLQHQKKQVDLRELAAVLRTVGLGDDVIDLSIIGSDWGASILRLNPDLVWPYFAERLHLLEQALTLKSDVAPYARRDGRHKAIIILSLFPRLPQRFVPLFWDVAFGNDKNERALAQEFLSKLPNKEQKIIAALASTQPNTRSLAAEWLGTLRHKEAIPALRVALAKEKNEIVKEKLIKSLETLGVGLEELLDIDKLDREAEQGLKKGVPQELAWFPFSHLPPVRWADSGKPVPAAIIHWFIVQSCRLKSGEASTTLRRYCSLFQKEDREQLGRFVLQTWIAEDTKLKYTPEEAAVEAKNLAQQSWGYALRVAMNPSLEQEIYQSCLNRIIGKLAGSQASSKGILAVAGACCSGDAAPVVHHYIKEWFGYRASQCKALLQVLAWIDDPRATQVILSVANRFRTKAIQEEALRQCELLAERKGWTMDELADRTIPTASLDETGSIELDYGSRKFTAHLTEQMTIAVTNDQGKVISSLPDANQLDDPEKVKQAKATLSSARKELKSVLAQQQDRLYEALCTQRSWWFDDWDTYLRRHPIMGRHCQRLVWAAYEGDRVVQSFRPLADGTLTNHLDDEVALKPETLIRLAHDETLTAEDRTAWLQHLSDYEVEPLFQQFGKATFTLPDDLKEAREINEFLGYITETFALRSRLTKLGYTRGPIGDSGGFRDYRKTFLRLGIAAVIEFSGSGVPEENFTVALKRLYFTRSDNDNPYRAEELTLAELPRVLITECWNDMRMAAADGPGFAADWKKHEI